MTFHANCKETICMKCHILFSETNKKKYFRMSTENFPRSAKH